MLGHVLNAGLTIALASAAAALTEHPSTAAIVTLTVTVGTWIINFVAAVQGGVWERAAGYTPTAMVAEFQHGLVRFDVVLIALLLIALGLSLAAIWTRLGIAVSRRTYESFAAGAFLAAAMFASTFMSTSVDLSENRANSFPKSDEIALRRIRSPLRIEAHLAPEDPRRVDLERHAVSKLRRVMPRLEVRYVSATTTGLFEQTTAHYGEIWYELDGRRTMNRTTTVDGVLDTIFELAGVTPQPVADDQIFRGHPLAVPPKGAATIFYGIWPALVLAGALFLRRRHS
jgi:MYXO-CTERM domain-containing protein